MQYEFLFCKVLNHFMYIYIVNVLLISLNIYGNIVGGGAYIRQDLFYPHMYYYILKYFRMTRKRFRMPRFGSPLPVMSSWLLP